MGPPILPPLPLCTTPQLYTSLSVSMRPPLQPIWINVASLNPWLLDFCTVLFSDGSGYYLFWGLVVILSVVAWGGRVCLPMPPSWPEVLILSLLFSFLKKYIYWLCYYNCPISPLHSTLSCPPSPTHIPPFSSCPWVIHINCLTSTFPILFLTLPLSIFYLPFMLLTLCTFPPHSPIDNPPCDLHLYGSVPVLVVCLVCSCFCFRCGH